MDLIGQEYRDAFDMKEMPCDSWVKRAVKGGSYNYRMEHGRSFGDELTAVASLDQSWKVLDGYTKDCIFSFQKITIEMRDANLDTWMCCNADASLKVSPWVVMNEVFTDFDQELQDFHNPVLSEEQEKEYRDRADEACKALKTRLEKAQEHKQEMEIELAKLMMEFHRLNLAKNRPRTRKRPKLDDFYPETLLSEIEKREGELETRSKVVQAAQKSYDTLWNKTYRRLVESKLNNPMKVDGEFAYDRRLKLPIIKSDMELEGLENEQNEYFHSELFRKACLERKVMTGPNNTMNMHCVKQENGEMDGVTFVQWLLNFAEETPEKPVVLVLENIGLYHTATNIVSS